MEARDATPDALSAADCAFLAAQRVAHLATADAAGAPHAIPVCFAVLDERTIAFAVDDKPKPRGRLLKRLRNLAENPRFALVADRWDEDWGRLAYLMVLGKGARCSDADTRRAAVRALRARYPQYVAMGLDADRHEVIALSVERVHRWGAIA
jgi:coenzyme F420-0:L-glutamate ligase/coenzyme F420-1:gamma-L-glutamate ligase